MERRGRSDGRYWPRDGPVRWVALVRGLALWVVVLGSAVAHLGLAGLYAAAVASGRVGGIVGWLLAAVWIALAAWLVQNWLCFRWRIVLAPVTAAVLLALAGRWLAR